MRYLLVGTLAVLVFTPAAFGHGSSYRGPCNEVPPGARDPMPPRPTFNASSPGTWEWWWSLNKEEFLYPHATRVSAGRPGPGDKERALLESAIFPALEKALRDKMTCPARSRVALAAGAVAASRGGAPASLVERLRELSLDRKQQRVVQACTAIALGMAGQRDEAVVPALSRTVLDKNAATSVRGAAALAIGLLRISTSSDDPLQLLARGTLETAARADSADLRASAAVAMGLDGSPELIPVILKLLNRILDGGGTPPDPGTPARFTDKALSLVVTGLGKFADLDPAPHASKVVTTLRRISSGSARHCRRASVAALGRWGAVQTIDEMTALKVLDGLQRARKGEDPLASRLALLSIAHVGRASPHERVRRDSIAILNRALAESEGEATPYAALAIGIAVGSAPLSDEMRAELAGKLRGELGRLYVLTLRVGAPAGATPATPSDPPPPPGAVTPVPTAPAAPDAPTVAAPARSRAGEPAPASTGTPATGKTKPVDRVAPGAYALALGLIGDETAAPLLFTILTDEAAHSRLRGYAAIALGMLRDKQGVMAIRKVLEGPVDAELMVLGSIGAGLAGNTGLLPALLARTSDDTLTNRQRTMAIRAVGKLGDRSAIPELLKLVKGGGETDVVRSTAAIAIADLFDKDGALVLTRLTRDLSAYAKNDTFDLILSVF